MNLNKPKAILFDLDDTFYSYTKSHNFALKKVSLKLKNEFGISEAIFKKHYQIENKKIKKILKNTSSSHNKFLYFKNILERLNFTPYVKMAIELNNLYWEIFYNEMYAFPSVNEFLNDIKKMDISIGVITNYDTTYQFKKILCLGLENEIDYLVSSEEVGIDKPNEKPFLKMMKLLSLKKSESWMIGDSVNHDLEPAKKIMNSVTFLFSNQENSKRNSYVDFVFSDYAFLRNKLSQFN